MDHMVSTGAPQLAVGMYDHIPKSEWAEPLRIATCPKSSKDGFYNLRNLSYRLD